MITLVLPFRLNWMRIWYRRQQCRLSKLGSCVLKTGWLKIDRNYSMFFRIQLFTMPSDREARAMTWIEREAVEEQI